MILKFFLFVVGACVGSFLNVCIWRLPREESIVKPRSHCPHCNHGLAWYDNIPIFSYLILRGRCRYCKHPISFRYFVVELITASLFLGFFCHFGLSLVFLIYTALACALIVVTFIDLKHRIIPDEITIPGLILGLIVSFCYPGLHGKAFRILPIFGSALWASVLGVIVGGGVIYLTGIAGNFIFKKESMGGGDVKLLAMVGAFLGWKLALFTLFSACIFGSVVGLPLRIWRKVELIPFGPFLSIGAICSIIWGEEIIRWLLY